MHDILKSCDINKFIVLLLILKTKALAFTLKMSNVLWVVAIEGHKKSFCKLYSCLQGQNYLNLHLQTYNRVLKFADLLCFPIFQVVSF